MIIHTHDASLPSILETTLSGAEISPASLRQVSPVMRRRTVNRDAARNPA